MCLLFLTGSREWFDCLRSISFLFFRDQEGDWQHPIPDLGNERSQGIFLERLPNEHEDS